MFASDPGSDRAADIVDYQNTCASFIKDISGDYADWVDRYSLVEEETKRRKTAIESIVKTTVDWIFRYANTIRKVDIVMNDGVNKMAENTAGYPFAFEIIVNDSTRYTQSSVRRILLNFKALPRPGRTIRVSNYQKDQLLLLNSSGPIEFSLSEQSRKQSDLLDDYLVLDASRCSTGDLVSVTMVVEEVQDGYAVESRGYSTIILLT